MRYTITYEISAGEYTGDLVVDALKLSQIDEMTVLADGVLIRCEEGLIVKIDPVPDEEDARPPKSPLNFSARQF